MAKVSKNSLELLKKLEGYREDAYQDSAGVWTIGYGTTKYGNGVKVKKGDKLNKEKASELFEKQVNEHSSTIEKYIGVALNQNQFDALALFQYNVGKNILKKDPALLGYINKRDWTNVARVMKLYNKAGGKLSQGLVNRRQVEVDLFLKK